MKFMFSTVYRVPQKDFYAHLYSSMWASVVARRYINDIQTYNTSHADKHVARA
jgi:hypothetical protein